MPAFSVLLLYPDYISDDHATMLRTVVAETPKAAISAVRAMAAEIDGARDGYDFKLLLCSAGAIRELVVDEMGGDDEVAGNYDDFAVTVEVSGGTVQSVTSNGGPVTVLVRDYDNKTETDEYSEEVFEFNLAGTPLASVG
jgi:hypothetical protein